MSCTGPLGPGPVNVEASRETCAPLVATIPSKSGGAPPPVTVRYEAVKEPCTLHVPAIPANVECLVVSAPPLATVNVAAELVIVPLSYSALPPPFTSSADEAPVMSTPFRFRVPLITSPVHELPVSFACVAMLLAESVPLTVIVTPEPMVTVAPGSMFTVSPAGIVMLAVIICPLAHGGPVVPPELLPRPLEPPELPELPLDPPEPPPLLPPLPLPPLLPLDPLPPPLLLPARPPGLGEPPL